jgi:hypothetical protein
MAPLPGVIQIQVHSTMFRICDVYIGIRIQQIRTVPMDYGSGTGSVPYPALFLRGLRDAKKNSIFAYDGMYLL